MIGRKKGPKKEKEGHEKGVTKEWNLMIFCYF